MSEFVFWVDDDREDYEGNHPCERREDVVRCRDCVHAHEFDDADEGYAAYAGKLDCRHFSQWDYYDDVPGSWPVEPDGFCKWGVRREDANA